MPSRKLEVIITGDSSSLDKAFRSSKQDATGFEKGMKTASVGAAAALATVGLAAKVGFSELNDATKVAAQTNQVLKTTGGIANVTAKDVDTLATAIMRKSGIDDEAIKSTQNLLLGFTKIRNEAGKGSDIFNRTTQAVTDFSVRTGKDASSAAVAFGKALNDPIRGLGGLAKAGVTFTAAQKEQIRALVESGDQLGAQKLILSEVERRYGGAAEAAGNTFAGQLNIAKEEGKNFAAELVEGAIPTLTAMGKGLQTVTGFLEDHKTATKALIGVVVGLSAAILAVNVATKVWATVQVAARAATVAWTAAQWLLNAALTANPIGIVIVALTALVAGVVLAYRNSETFRTIVTGAFDAVKAAATFVLNFFRSNWPIIAALLTGPFAPLVALATNAFGVRSALMGAVTATLNWVRSNWKEIATIVSGPFAPLVALATGAFGVRAALVGAFGKIVDGVSDKVGDLISLVRGIPGRIISALGNVSGLLYGAGQAIIGGLISGMTSRLGELSNLASSIAGKIASLKGPIEYDRKLLVPHGQAIIEGLQAGMEGSLGGMLKAVSGFAPAIQKATPQSGAAAAPRPVSARSQPAQGASGGWPERIVLQLDGRTITEVVRREMYRIQNRNGSLGFN